MAGEITKGMEATLRATMAKIDPDYFKELIRDPKTGEMREATAIDITVRAAPQVAARAKGEAALQRQENLDRSVMSKAAADKKWGKRAN